MYSVLCFIIQHSQTIFQIIITEYIQLVCNDYKIEFFIKLWNLLATPIESQLEKPLPPATRFHSTTNSMEVGSWDEPKNINISSGPSLIVQNLCGQICLKFKIYNIKSEKDVKLHCVERV